MTKPDFQYRNPVQAEFWEERFAHEFTPWRQTASATELVSFIAAQPRCLRVLVPGCGHGEEVAQFIAAGWPVTAFDFAERAIEQARSRLANLIRQASATVDLFQADFFNYQQPTPFDLIFERAFFCALPATQRQAIVNKWHELLAPGALLAGYFYLQMAPHLSEEKPRGPPFICDYAEWLELMQVNFELLEHQPVKQSLPVFAAHEYWQVWRKKVVVRP